MGYTEVIWGFAAYQKEIRRSYHLLKRHVLVEAGTFTTSDISDNKV